MYGRWEWWLNCGIPLESGLLLELSSLRNVAKQLVVAYRSTVCVALLLILRWKKSYGVANCLHCVETCLIYHVGSLLVIAVWVFPTFYPLA